MEIKNKSLLNIYEVVENFLKPNELQKKKNGEVFTPLELIREKCEKIPKDFWSNPNVKVLDPCCGIGNYEVVLIEYFMNGLKDKIPDEKKRMSHITNEILYCYDICPINISLCKMITNIKNVYCKDFLTSEFNIKFDLVIGNPPYQEVNKKNKSIHGKENLYTKFIRKGLSLIKNDGFLLYITPTSWLGPTGILEEMLEYNFLYLNINECEKHFIKVGSTFSYYLIKKNSFSKKERKNRKVCKIKEKTKVICKYNNKIYNSFIKFEKYKMLPQLLNDKMLSIQKKVFDLTNSVNQKFIRQDGEIKKVGILVDKKDDKNIYSQIIKHNKIMYSSKKHKYQNEKKVLLFRSGYLKPMYDESCGIGENIMFLIVNNKKEGMIIVNIYKSKLYELLISINKFSGFNNGKIINMLYNKNLVEYFIKNEGLYSDSNLYKYFNLSKDEIDFIDSI